MSADLPVSERIGGPLPSLPGWPGLGRLWAGRSLRAQLVILLLGIDLFAALLIGGVTIVNTRRATQIEMSASLELAARLVHESIERMRQGAPESRLLQDLHFQGRYLRHVRIHVTDAAGQPLPFPEDGEAAAPDDDQEHAPDWFAAIMDIAEERRMLPVAVDGRMIGTVVLVGEPDDEIAEVWEDMSSLTLVAGSVNLLAILVLYAAFGRALRPLGRLESGLRDLERQDYSVRLEPLGVRELAVIAARFNILAADLGSARTENRRLSRRLVTSQDDERRRIAIDLHDEFGPCLFGIVANASSIETQSGRLVGEPASALRERARDILAIVARLQAMNRGLLKRLRPMSLGHVALTETISDLVREFAGHDTGTAFRLTHGTLRPSYGDSVDLTIYRCVQEGLTNAVRHARPSRVEIDLRESQPVRGTVWLVLRLSDDGIGIDPAAPKGFGLMGISERVSALGGECTIETPPGGGTTLRLTVPLDEGEAGSGAWSSSEGRAR